MAAQDPVWVAALTARWGPARPGSGGAANGSWDTWQWSAGGKRLRLVTVSKIVGHGAVADQWFVSFEAQDREAGVRLLSFRCVAPDRPDDLIGRLLPLIGWLPS